VAALTGLLALGATASAPAQPTPGCLGKSATIVGTHGDDVIRGTDRSDVIVGLGGNDTIDGLDGGDTICGGDGNDLISTGRSYFEVGTNVVEGTDVVSGDSGDDVLTGDVTGFSDPASMVVSFEEAPGPVVVNLVTGRATGWGDDRLSKGEGIVEFGAVKGSAYADSITGDDYYNWLSGGPGDDHLFGLDTSDFSRVERATTRSTGERNAVMNRTKMRGTWRITPRHRGASSRTWRPGGPPAGGTTGWSKSSSSKARATPTVFWEGRDQT
jgi:Ca2+-binding RTX toxin-like protein